MSKNIPPHLKEVPFWVRSLARLILKIFGWQVYSGLSGFPKAIILGVPHTTNWDGPMAFLAGYSTGARCRWLGKSSLFKFPMGYLSRILGGIPIDRNMRQNAVEQIIAQFEAHESLFIILAPEGTRHYAPHWKSGFYHMAQGANIPIVMAKIDYTSKTVDMREFLHPTGDIKADMDRIRAYYADANPKHPERFGEIRLKEEAEA